MAKIFFVFCVSFILFYNSSVFSQTTFNPPCFTWMGGSTTIAQYGTYGIQGVSSALNMPGSRGNSYTWKDASGNFWLFGGWGYAAATTIVLNDLWKYNPISNQWTWVSGSTATSQSGVYGTKGVGSTSNIPGGRVRSQNCWKDSTSLWLFGGMGYDKYGNLGRLNDLWKYDIATNTWAWIAGSDTVNKHGVYGVKGVSSTTNIPGARGYSQSWTDNSGNFWLMGGRGFGASGLIGYLNDLWKYDPTQNSWTWMAGDSTLNNYGIYGTKGVSSPLNVPGGRIECATWVDGGGDMYLYGGYGYLTPYSNNFGLFNDLWKYSPSSNQWLWLNGDTAVNQTGVYGVIGLATPQNKPGSRALAQAWTAFNNLYLSGGGGYGANFTNSNGVLNDLWEYNTSSNQWTWIAGSTTYSAPSVYGSLQIGSQTNIPGGRCSASCWENNNKLYLFGGFQTNNVTNQILNDLWKIDLESCNDKVGLKENSTNSNFLFVFPNPNNGEFTFQSSVAMEIIVTNELGQIVCATKLNESNFFSEKIKGLEAGIYIAIGTSQNLSVKQKIIVTN